MKPKITRAFVFYRSHATNEDQVLLLVRSATDPYKPGGIDIPGGGVEAGESLQDAMLREIQEETGIVVDPSVLHEVTDSGVVSNDTSVDKHVFIARVEDPNFTLSLEHESATWYPLDEAARLFPHPFYGKVLQNIIDRGLHQKTFQQ